MHNQPLFQGWHIGLLIYRLCRYIGTFWNIGYRYRQKWGPIKYRLSVIGFCQISALNIGYISVIFPQYIGKTPIYRQFLEYRLSVSVKLRTDKISVIGNRLWSDIGNQLSAKFNRYAIPGFNLPENNLGWAALPSCCRPVSYCIEYNCPQWSNFHVNAQCAFIQSAGKGEFPKLITALWPTSNTEQSLKGT